MYHDGKACAQGVQKKKKKKKKKMQLRAVGFGDGFCDVFFFYNQFVIVNGSTFPRLTSQLPITLN